MTTRAAVAEPRTTGLREGLRFHTATLGLEVASGRGEFDAGFSAGGQTVHPKRATRGIRPWPPAPGDPHRAGPGPALSRTGIALVRPVQDTPWRTRTLVIRDDRGRTITPGGPA